MIALIIVSLLGITGLQYFWITSAYSIKEAQFSRGVRDAMERVVGQLEMREKVVFLSKEFLKDSVSTLVKSMETDRQNARDARFDNESDPDYILNIHNLPPPPPPPDEFEFRINMNGETQVIVVPSRPPMDEQDY